ncbi:MAG TPA: hypothetical protein P5335_09680 [Flavobacterium sp.]|nr:hypothetical protein [Flavobacterium sp.]HRZ75190.1 hypothetical protein [Flavobacterium sp.]
METIQTKLESRRNDILYYLDKTIDKIKLLQLENIRNKEIYLVSDSAISDISITKQLIETSNLLLPIEIANNVNQIFIADKTVSSVIVNIVNSKRTIKDCPAYLKLTV